MLSIVFSFVILIISLDTTDWSSYTSSKLTCILYNFSVIFPSQFIMHSLLFVYASVPVLRLSSDVIEYISYVTSSVVSDALYVKKYESIPFRNNVMRMSNLGKYMLWSSTYGSMACISDVYLTNIPVYLSMSGGVRLLSMLGTDRSFLNMSIHKFSVYWHVYWTYAFTIDNLSISW